MTDTATPTRVATPPAAFTRIAGALDRRDALVRLVSERLEQLRELAPGLRLRRSVFDGAWVVGLHAGGRSDPVRPFSRLDFELRLADEITITRRTTLRQRDLPSESATAPSDADGLVRLTRFVEGGVADFAANYFARD